MLPAQRLSVLHYPFVYAVVVSALRKVREGRVTRQLWWLLQFDAWVTRLS
jgi:hypothetical protein